jgi:hypothetical protein
MVIGREYAILRRDNRQVHAPHFSPMRRYREGLFAGAAD